MLKIVEVHGVGSILWLSTDLKKAYIKASGCVPKESKNNLEYVSAECTCFSHWPSNTAGPLQKRVIWQKGHRFWVFWAKHGSTKIYFQTDLDTFLRTNPNAGSPKIHTRFVTGCPLAISSMRNSRPEPRVSDQRQFALFVSTSRSTTLIGTDWFTRDLKTCQENCKRHLGKPSPSPS